MGDAGEGLIDAESRFQERLAEREQEAQKKRSGSAPAVDPERKRRTESLRLALADLKRQEAATQNPTRKEQIRKALADLERQLAQL